MFNIDKCKELLEQGIFQNKLMHIYCGRPEDAKLQAERYINLVSEFKKRFGSSKEIGLFSAPGRTEIGGNHTDHQHGRVLAAGVNLDVIAAVSKNNDNVIRVKSEGYEMDTVLLDDLSVQQSEINRSSSLIRGIAARFKELGFEIGGFDACTTSNVLKGSGLSSSAAFEVLIGTIMNHLYNNGKADAVKIAQIGQFAENKYFGKPCGLMDQTASSVGGFVTIDFENTENPIVEKVDFDFAGCGYNLCIVDTGGNHADLTDDYASCPSEMKAVAKALGKEVLRSVDEKEFFAKLGELREKCSDRAILRAIHFFADNARVPKQVNALKAGDFEGFKQLVIESGKSSFMYLQNVFTCKNPSEQGVSLALAVSEKLLAGKGAWRVHGGGFAGTIQAFVPSNMLEEYKSGIEAVMGKDKCHVLSIRPVGGIMVDLQ